MCCAGYEPIALEDPSHMEQHLEGASLLGADTFDAEVVVRALEAHPHLKTLLWTAEPMARALRFIKDIPSVSNIIGRPNFDSAPRGWELMMVLRRLAYPEEDSPKFAWFLDWGFSGFQERIDTTSKRDRAACSLLTMRHLGRRATGRTLEGFQCPRGTLCPKCPMSKGDT